VCKFVAPAFMIALLLLGCGSDDSDPKLAPPELADHRWRLTSATDAQGAPIEALDAEVAGPIDMGFYDRYMSWDENCNGLNGSYAVEGQMLRITGPGLPSTLVGCTPSQERAREALRRSFYSEMTWSVAPSAGSSTLALTSLVDGSVAMFVATPK
jgi:hypothetical protein